MALPITSRRTLPLLQLLRAQATRPLPLSVRAASPFATTAGHGPSIVNRTITSLFYSPPSRASFSTTAAARAASGAPSSSSPSPLGGLGSLLSFPGLDGGAAITPASLQGKVVLLVNTASYCGYTPQLTSLQALHAKYGGRGLVVLAVPCNQFGEQEPDGEAQIGAFYRGPPYGVTFPITGKQEVLGGGAHPAFRWLGGTLGEAGTPSWNFAKYLVGRGGELAGLFAPGVDPSDASVTAAIEAELTKGV